MKKIITMAVCAMFVLTASAQRASSSSSSFKTKSKEVASSVQFGVRAGMNVSNMKQKYSWSSFSESEKADAHVGYHVGFIVDVPIFKNYLYIQPGLYLTQKGCKSSYSDSDDYDGWYYSETDKLNPTYMEIPILFSGRYNVNNNVQLQLDFGPYFGCGLFGKYKEDWKESDRYDTFKGVDSYKIFKKESDSYDYDEDEEGEGGLGLKRFDAGLIIGAGVLLQKHYYIGFKYEFGLANMIPGDWVDDDEKWSLKNKNFMLTVGYNF